MPSQAPARSSGSNEWSFARVLAVGLALVAILLLVWLLVAVKGVIQLAMLAVLFAILLDSGVRGLRALLPFPRWAALLLIWLLFVAIIVGGALFLTPRVAADMQQLAERIPLALMQLENAIRNTAWGREVVEQISKLEQSSSLRSAAQQFLGLFSSLVGVITATLVVMVLGVFIASEPHTYIENSLRLIPPASRARAGEIAAALGRALRWWLLGRFASMAIVFALTWIGLAVLGVPLPFLLALIAGLFSFVPTFGPVASAVPAVLVGLSMGPYQALWVALLYLGIQTVESYGITPLIQRRTVLMPPAFLVIFQLMMAVLAGVLGVLLATPLLVVIMVLVAAIYLEDELGEAPELP